MSDKIISFPGAEPLPENPIELKKPESYNFCKHPRITLDGHKRAVECSDCAAVLDPFDFLQLNAELLQRAWKHHAAVSMKVAELQTRCAALEKERKSLQGKVGRIREKTPVIDVRGKDRL